jgi:hypothetical protein
MTVAHRGDGRAAAAVEILAPLAIIKVYTLASINRGITV